MKYIMIEQKLTAGVSRFVPIIFPDTLSHSDIAKAVLPFVDKGSVASAGDIDDIGRVECSGGSCTLKMASNPERDSDVIRSYDLFHGLVY